MSFFDYIGVCAGLGMSIHFYLMANAAPQNAPIFAKILIWANSFSGAYLASSIFFGGGAEDAAIFALFTIFLFIMWLWSNGVHVCDLIKSIISKDSNET